MLSGPYLELGNSDELKVTCDDLGEAIQPQMSESGDLLYLHIEHEKTRNKKGVARASTEFRLRHVDGTTQSFPHATRVIMTPGGKVYAIYPTSNGYRVEQNGRQIVDDKSHLGYDFLETSIPGDDGLILSSEDRSFGRIAYGPVKTWVTMPNETVIGGWQSSSTLGTYGVVSSQNLGRYLFPQNELAHFVEGKLAFMGLPDWCANPFLVMCRDRMYLNPDDILVDSRVYELHDGVFTCLPCPPKSHSVDLVCGNSKREFIVRANETSSDGKSIVATDYFVRGNKCYDLKSLLAQVNLRPSPSALGVLTSESRFMAENTSFAILLNAHLYLVKVAAR